MAQEESFIARHGGKIVIAGICVIAIVIAYDFGFGTTVASEEKTYVVKGLQRTGPVTDGLTLYNNETREERYFAHNHYGPSKLPFLQQELVLLRENDIVLCRSYHWVSSVFEWRFPLPWGCTRTG